jgi:hypothetical protein
VSDIGLTELHVDDGALANGSCYHCCLQIMCRNIGLFEQIFIEDIFTNNRERDG